MPLSLTMNHSTAPYTQGTPARLWVIIQNLSHFITLYHTFYTIYTRYLHGSDPADHTKDTEPLNTVWHFILWPMWLLEIVTIMCISVSILKLLSCTYSSIVNPYACVSMKYAQTKLKSKSIWQKDLRVFRRFKPKYFVRIVRGWHLENFLL